MISMDAVGLGSDWIAIVSQEGAGKELIPRSFVVGISDHTSHSVSHVSMNNGRRLT